MFDWSGKNGDKSGKGQGKSGNFDILFEWQPCIKDVTQSRHM